MWIWSTRLWYQEAQASRPACDRARGSLHPCLHLRKNKGMWGVKKSKDKWAFGFSLILNPLILFLNQEKSEQWKAEKLYASHMHVYGRVCMCVFLVNRALIALALQLGDFLSKKKSGAIKGGIFKVLKCVIILHFFLIDSLQKK